MSKQRKKTPQKSLEKEFKPNKSPKQVFRLGAFGGTYFRPIDSSINQRHYTSKEALADLPKQWFHKLDLDTHVISPTYDKQINKYKVKCGSSLESWENSGWIHPQDPYGWFQWYCRYSMGRRSPDDARQIGRWLKLAGPKGRFRRSLMNKIIKKNTTYDDFTVSPVIRQVLLHWGYQLTKRDLDAYKRSKKG